jgi:hypothetical protein
MWMTLGLQRLLNSALGGTDIGNLTLKLFKNDVTPVAGSIASLLTEADFTGYSAKTLTSGSWGAATTASGIATAAYAQQTWTATAIGATVYGWYIVNGAGELLAAKRFDSAITIANGTVIRATPSVPFSQPA